MKKILLLTLLLLVPALAQAATWSWNFENGVVDSMSLAGDPLCLHSNVGADTSGWQSGGIRAYFSNTWHLVRDTRTYATQCDYDGEVEVTKDWYQPTFTNAPNGGHQCLALNYFSDFNIGSCKEEAAQSYQWQIHFSTPIKTFKFWMSSQYTTNWRVFLCPPTDHGWEIPADSDNLFSIKWDGGGQDEIFLGADAFYENACSGGDQNRELCQWQQYTYYFPAGTSYVGFTFCNESDCNLWINEWNYLAMGILIDDMEASTSLPPCPDPPCEWSRSELARSETSTIEPARVGDPLPRGVRLATLPRHVTPATRVTWGRVKQIYR